MDDRRDFNRTEAEEPTPASHTSRWLSVAVVALIVALGLAVGYTLQQRTASSQLASHDADMTASVNQMQNQIDSLNGKLNQLATAPPANAAQPAVDPAAAKRRTAAENKRYKQLQSQLADQQKELKDTQDQVTQARTDLAGSLSSTRDELNGSIARTHEELVALEQKGERNYVEFDLKKSKQFKRTGPIMVSLRKVDAKHKHFDLAMVVEDNQISKKNVNLYEPVWINSATLEQVQVVVNKVDKDHVHGYVSAPKYMASMTPVSNRTSTTTNDSTANQTISSSTDSSSPTPQQQPQ